jgi:predicted DCC family thiol-disulfide oxidoreductase YuxK
LAGMHVSIAVLMGLPFFSAIMLVGDAVFLPDRLWTAVGRRIAGPAYAGVMEATPTLVYDGDCAFCSTTVRWARRWCAPAVSFVPWQFIDLDAHGLTEAQVTQSVQWLPTGGSPVRSGSRAVARTLLRSRWPWRPVGLLMLVPPLSWLASLAYRLIAANRYRLPGGTPACAASSSTRSTTPRTPTQGGSAQSLGDVGGGAHDAGAGTRGVELTERDHAD